jgi:predicted 3-demethylubiquinone-9 3-methyltransferase (glyoxalase superfamily)
LGARADTRSCGRCCLWFNGRIDEAVALYLSWQIIPSVLPQLLQDSDRAKAGRAMQAMLTMNKIDIATLARVAAGD